VSHITQKLDALLGGIVSTMCFAALVLSTMGILSRYVLSSFTLDWTGEVVIFLVIWAVLLSLPRVERRNAHVRVDFLLNKMGGTGQRMAILVSSALGLALSGFLIWSGWEVVIEALRWDERTPSTLRVPLWIYYAALSTAFALNAIFTLERLVAVLRGADAAAPLDLAD